MRYSTDRLFRTQFNFLRRKFLQDGELPLADVLSRETIEQALDSIDSVSEAEVPSGVVQFRFQEFAGAHPTPRAPPSI